MANNPDLGLYDARAMEQVLSKSESAPRLNAVLLWTFAGLALLLSSLGVYGVTSYAVTQRRREYAIRMALGATPRRIFQMVTLEGAWVGVGGVLIGLAGTLLLGRTTASLFYGVEPTDPRTLTMSAGLVFMVTLLACVRPAWRATTVDPMTLIRTD